jgi:hypothetical protein
VGWGQPNAKLIGSNAVRVKAILGIIAEKQTLLPKPKNTQLVQETKESPFF